MKTVGVICEYNPFHNGHAKQLRAIDGVKVCLMSGNFVQRGEPALLSQSVRARAAVLCGAILVYLFIEIQPRYRCFAMPFIFLLASVPGAYMTRKKS